MRHTPASARAHAQRVYAELLRKRGASVNNEGNLYYNANENFKNNNKKIPVLTKFIGEFCIQFLLKYLSDGHKICLSVLPPIKKHTTTTVPLIKFSSESSIDPIYENIFLKNKRKNNILIYLCYDAYFYKILELSKTNQDIQYFVFCNSPDRFKQYNNVIRCDLNKTGLSISSIVR